MAELAVSGDELQTLLQITSALSATSQEIQCLYEVAPRVARLVPFEKCILMHERGTDGDAATLIYEFVGAPVGDNRAGPTHTTALHVARYLEHFERVETFQSAFFWRAASDYADDSDPRSVEFIKQAGLSRGTAGLINSAEGSLGRIATLMQFQCAGDKLPAKHLFFVNIIVFYLHVYLVHRSARLFASNRADELTHKERQVLQWIVGGKTSWEVGRILSMSERTVKFHLRNIYSKLNVANRTQAVITASRLNLI